MPQINREEPITFKRAKMVVPSLLTTDEIADHVKYDRHNLLQTARVTHLNNGGDTLEVFYAPNDDYTLDTHNFYLHEPITSIW